MAVEDRGAGGVAASCGGNHEEEVGDVGREFDGAEAAVGERAGAQDVGVGHGLENFELALVVAGEGAQDDGRLDAAQAFGVGDGDALDVLDDVAAAQRVEVLDGLAEGGGRQRGAVGEGDGLGAAEGADELAVQQVGVGAGR